MDLHNYKRRLERTLDLIKKSENISEHNKEILLKFNDYCSCQNISFGKTDAYMFYSKKFAISMKKDLELATKEDIMKFISELNNDENYSPETKVSFKVMIRKLYKMIRNVEGKKDFPPEVSWINTTSPKNQDMLPEQLITKEEIERIIQAADNTRDKAFLATLLESGCRIGEVGLMKIKDVCFEEIGARISVTGKTGPRKMKVVRCVPYHQTWINCHPLNENPDSYLWYNPQWKEVKNGKEI